MKNVVKLITYFSSSKHTYSSFNDTSKINGNSSSYNLMSKFVRVFLFSIPLTIEARSKTLAASSSVS